MVIKLIIKSGILLPSSNIRDEWKNYQKYMHSHNMKSRRVLYVYTKNLQ